MTNVSKTLNHLMGSMEASMEYVKEKSESAKNLFCLIGFMPDGVTSNDLCLIVGDGSKIEEDLQLLINA